LGLLPCIQRSFSQAFCSAYGLSQANCSAHKDLSRKPTVQYIRIIIAALCSAYEDYSHGSLALHRLIISTSLLLWTNRLFSRAICSVHKFPSPNPSALHIRSFSRAFYLSIKILHTSLLLCTYQCEDQIILRASCTYVLHMQKGIYIM
jgi:hypothetical protein